MSNLFFRDPRLLALTIALVLVSGFSAFGVLPRAEDPELADRNAVIVTRYPGANAERVEALVTERLEDELSEIEELRLLTSTSRAGVSVVALELLDAVSSGETDAIWSRVRDRMDDVDLPPEALEPEFEEQDVRASTLIAALVWRADDTPFEASVMRRLSEELEHRLRSLSGTEKTELFGAGDEEIAIEVDPVRLAALGLSAADVADIVAGSDSKVAAGVLRGAASDLLIEVEGELDSLERIRATPVAYGDRGEVVRLGELGRVVKAAVDPPRELTIVDGERAIGVSALMKPGERVDRWAADARDVLARFEAELPSTIELSLLFDQSLYTERRLANLFENLALGVLCVMGVILVTMGWRSALLVGSALPLSILMVFAGLRLLGIPMQQMSVTGLIIALGLLIDNAIVIVDEVRRELARGGGRAEAVAVAVKRLFVPLLGSTLTTVLAFMPIVLMPGGAGEFVGTIAVSVILALCASFFLSMTVVPALAAWLDRFVGGRESDTLLGRGFRNGRMLALYERGLDALLARPVLGIALAAVLPIVGFVKGGELEEQFFPNADRDQFQVELFLPAFSSIGETRAAALAARDLILEHPDALAVHWFVGNSAPKFYYNLFGSEDDASYYAQALVQASSAEAVRPLVQQIQRTLDEALPSAQVIARELEQGPPFNAPIEAYLYGPELDVLRELGDELRGVLAEVGSVVHTRATLRDGRPELLLETDELEVNRAGLDRVDLARSLAATFEGALGGTLLEDTEELPVRVRIAGEQRGSVDELAATEIRTGDGPRDWAPLSVFADLTLVPEIASLPHRERERVNAIQGYLVGGTFPNEALAEFGALIEERGIELPPGYSLEFGGEGAERDRAVSNLAASVGVLLVLMVATLVLSFHSFRMAGLIGIVGAFSIGLALLALWIWEFPFGFMAIVGAMGLVGIAINDAIVVLAAIRADEAARTGDAKAVRTVVVRSTRHVLSTTLTTVAGFAPLLFDGGEFWPPLAVAIAGGVVGATLLALFLVPSAYRILVRPVPFLARVRRRSAVAGASPAAA